MRLRIHEQIHPLAWWLWAACIASMALITSNPLVLIGLGLVAATVGLLRQSEGGVSAALGSFLMIGIWVVGIRVAFQVIFGVRLPGHVLFSLPELQLPSWAAGVSLGGPVTAEALIAAAIAGCKLGVALIAFGAANALASPRDLMRILPQSLASLSVAVSVALAFVPELLLAIREQREARLLRGRPVRGLSGWRAMLVPVIEGSLRSASALSASMVSRGFGAAGATSNRLSLPFLTLGLSGLGLATAGAYLLAYPSLPLALAISLIVTGFAAIAAVLVGGSRKVLRTRYRPLHFGGNSWAVLISGLGLSAGLLIAQSITPDLLAWNPYTWTMPAVSWLCFASMLMGLSALLWSPLPSAMGERRLPIEEYVGSAR